MLDHRRFELRRSLASRRGNLNTIHFDGIILKERIIRGIRIIPFRLVSCELTDRANHGRLGGESEALGDCGEPVIVGAQGINCGAHQTPDAALAFDPLLAACDLDNGNVIARPVALFKNLGARQLTPLYRFDFRLALALNRRTLRFGHRVVFVRHDRRSVLVRDIHDERVTIIKVEIFGDTNRILGAPVRASLFGKVLRLEFLVGPFALETLFGNVFQHEAILRVRTIRHQMRPEIDGEHIDAGQNADLLLVGTLVLIFRDEAEIAFACDDGGLPGGEIRDIGHRLVLDVTRQILQNFGCRRIGVIVNRPHLDCGPILAHVVHDLRDVLIDLVERQAGTRTAGLRGVFAGCANLSRPLVERGEAQVLELKFPLLSVVVHATLQTFVRLLQDFLVGARWLFVVSGILVSHRCSPHGIPIRPARHPT